MPDSPATTDRTAPGAVPGETFTPGPWHVEDPLGPEILSIVAGGPEVYEWKHVAQLATTDEFDEIGDEIVIPAEEAKANARLIAAAPDLFAALKWFIDDIDGTHTVMTEFDAAVSAARRALSRATEHGAGDAGRDGEQG